MVYLAAAAVPPAYGAVCYYLWRSGTYSQLQSMGLSETTDEVAFSGVLAGFATVASTYGVVAKVVGPMVAAKEKKLLPGQTAKVESINQFARLAGPPTLLRGAALLLGFYAGGRVKTWLSCRELKAQEDQLKARKRVAAAKDKSRPAAK